MFYIGLGVMNSQAICEVCYVCCLVMLTKHYITGGYLDLVPSFGFVFLSFG